MNQSILILGRQPKLSLAELESSFGAEKVQKINDSAASLKLQLTKSQFKNLGGSIKLCTPLFEIESTDWKFLAARLESKIPEILNSYPSGKIKLGISVYGKKISTGAINSLGIKIKTACKKRQQTMRVIPSKSTELNAAQVLRNKLTKELGLEIVLIFSGNKTIVAKTIEIQDIDAYAARDQKRPARDARVGMLPPKLAQLIINLAQPRSGQVLLDPFCGTGVILQEAQLMGIKIYGTDIEPRMIDYSAKNLSWLASLPNMNPASHSQLLEVGDACNFIWQPFDIVACETYLGRPFTTEPNVTKLNEVIQGVNTIHRKFLQNLKRQTDTKVNICLAIPAWFTKNGIKHLPIIDQLTDLGYTRISFVHTIHQDLIYHREGQIVGRELLVLKRI